MALEIKPEPLGKDGLAAAYVAGPVLNMTGITWPADYPTAQSQRVPERAALIFDTRMTSYEELEGKAATFLTILHAEGILPGDRVVYLGKNSDLFFSVLFGALRAQSVLVPINWRNSAAEISYVLADSQAKLIVADRGFAGVLAVANADDTVPTIWIDDAAGDGLQARLARTDVSPAPAVDWERPCLQLYTSGTTGTPKGVIINQRMLAVGRQAELQAAAYADWLDDEVVLSAMPNFHIGGLCWVLGALVRGVTCVITADLAPSNLLRLILEYSITRTWLVPTAVRMVLHEYRSGGHHHAGLRAIHYGGAPMDSQLLRDGIEVFGCKFMQYYGMTEVSGAATTLAPADHDLTRQHLLRSVGQPIAGFELKICGLDKKTLKVDESGEIWLKGPAVMLGYWNRAEATAEAIEDNWYRTGDGGRLSHEGFLYLTDRIKEMIVSGGENIYPVEVETVLRQHPAIYEAAVFGIPDQRWGEVVAAALELRPGHDADSTEIVEFARRALAGYKVPKLISFAASLPRTASGKVQRGVARSSFLAKAATPQ